MYKRDYNFLNFKGKTKETDEWCFGTPIKTEEGNIVMIDEKLSKTVIRRETLCQKTNSKDVHGNPIFEGDIVATMPGRFNKDQIMGVVRFADEPGYLDSTVNAWKIHWAEHVRFETGNIEVIGNVYDGQFHDEQWLREHYSDDWDKILYFVEKEAREE